MQVLLQFLNDHAHRHNERHYVLRLVGSVMGIPFFSDLAFIPRGVESPSTRQLELRSDKDKGGILWPFLF